MTEQTYTTEQYEKMADQLSAEVPRFNTEDERNQAVLMLRQAAQMMREREALKLTDDVAGYVDPEQIADMKRNGGAVMIGTHSERYGRTVPVYFQPFAAAPEVK